MAILAVQKIVLAWEKTDKADLLKDACGFINTKTGIGSLLATTCPESLQACADPYFRN